MPNYIKSWILWKFYFCTFIRQRFKEIASFVLKFLKFSFEVAAYEIFLLTPVKEPSWKCVLLVKLYLLFYGFHYLLPESILSLQRRQWYRNGFILSGIIKVLFFFFLNFYESFLFELQQFLTITSSIKVNFLHLFIIFSLSSFFVCQIPDFL